METQMLGELQQGFCPDACGSTTPSSSGFMNPEEQLLQ